MDRIKGVVRFSVNAEDKHSGTIVDGVVDGLTPGYHGLHIHECGDLSNGCDSVGGHYNPGKTSHGGPDSEIDQRHAGDLGNIEADTTGRAKFRFVDRIIQTTDIIGRSVVVTEKEDDCGKGGNEQSLIDGNSGGRYVCLHQFTFYSRSFYANCVRKMYLLQIGLWYNCPFGRHFPKLQTHLCV